jgi:hypothetical protein
MTCERVFQHPANIKPWTLVSKESFTGLNRSTQVDLLNILSDYVQQGEYVIKI